jgi:hypothetical protein
MGGGATRLVVVGVECPACVGGAKNPVNEVRIQHSCLGPGSDSHDQLVV